MNNYWTWIICICVICITIFACVWLANEPDFGIKCKTKLKIIDDLCFSLNDDMTHEDIICIINIIRGIIKS